MSDHQYKHITSCAIRRLAEAFFGLGVHKVYMEQDGRDSLVLREIEEGLRLERQRHEDARYFTLQELEAEKEARKAVAESLHRERALRQDAESARRCSVRQYLNESSLQAARYNLAVKLQLQEGMYVTERLANSRLTGELEEARQALTEARGEVASLKEAARITQEVIQERDDLRSALEQAGNKLDRVRGAVEALKALGA